MVFIIDGAFLFLLRLIRDLAMQEKPEEEVKKEGDKSEKKKG